MHGRRRLELLHLPGKISVLIDYGQAAAGADPQLIEHRWGQCVRQDQRRSRGQRRQHGRRHQIFIVTGQAHRLAMDLMALKKSLLAER